MNDDSVQVLAKRISETNATCAGEIDANLALCGILGLIEGYVPGHGSIPENQQRYILQRVHEILVNSLKY